MESITLGKSGLKVSRPAFGALPIHRVPVDAAVTILRRAADNGITYFDTARLYSDSEKKLGIAFAGTRKNLIISSKSMSDTKEGILADLKITLEGLQTDYLDLYQFHNPKTVPMPGDGTERYETLAALKKSGVIRALGITSHSLKNAHLALESGLYDTLQFPFSPLATEEEEALAARARACQVGFIAMKALAGGLIDNIPAAVAYIGHFDNVVPIWGVQSIKELDDFLNLSKNPPVWDASVAGQIEALKKTLGAHFCRGCGYCLPCPQEIDIPFIARMDRLIRRAPWRTYATEAWIKKMSLAADCINCGACASRCPYQLNTPELVAFNVADYKNFMTEQNIALPF
jgi:aryl-alcohol dehydrogenase-like predicted oxidoreductase